MRFCPGSGFNVGVVTVRAPQVARKCVGERATLEVLRDGQLVDVEVTLREGSPLVPVHNYDKLPSYFIFGGETTSLSCSRVNCFQGYSSAGNALLDSYARIDPTHSARVGYLAVNPVVRCYFVPGCKVY